jgi:DNA-binding transcriptional LysR family regulator
MTTQKRTTLNDWENLRFFLEVHRRGSLSEAARKLGVNHTTVARRIAELETSLGVRLFDRSARGYDRTRAADELMPLAERVEETVSAVERRVASADVEHVGIVRVTTTEHIVVSFLAPSLPKLSERYPDIVVEAVADNRELSLSRREADMAIRLGRPRDVGLVARKLADISYAFYGQRGPGRRSTTVAFAKDDFVSYEESLSHVPQERWLHRVAPNRHVRFRTNTLNGLQAAARAGLGLALLPCFVGDQDPQLRRFHCAEASPTRELFVLVHPELRRSPRVRVVLDFIIESAGASSKRFLGGES